MAARITSIITAIQDMNMTISLLHKSVASAMTINGQIGARSESRHVNTETGCLVSATICLEDMIRVLKLPDRNRLSPCLASREETSACLRESSLDFLSRAEDLIDSMLRDACSACNTSRNLSSSSEVIDEEDDKLTRRKSTNYVYLPNDVCLTQEGIYHGGIFVPHRKGHTLVWCSVPSRPPAQRTARLCCLLNWLSLPVSTENRVLRNLDLMITKECATGVVGPVGLKCICQSDLEESGPIIILINFCVSSP
uniref:Wsv267-like protein n=1 Tax=Trachysalambria curvirostris nimavirus TaxID=2984282 RepID=A0A9C7C6Y0_9VIRU|nr:MAG: wsv267-like protein [Trachysalambria curvirostris nimavirus]